MYLYECVETDGLTQYNHHAYQYILIWVLKMLKYIILECI